MAFIVSFKYKGETLFSVFSGVNKRSMFLYHQFISLKFQINLEHLLSIIYLSTVHIVALCMYLE